MAAGPVVHPPSGRRVTWHVQPPEGREAVAAICRALFEDLDGLTARTDAVVDAAIEEFRSPSRELLEPDRFRVSRRLLLSFLHGVAEDHGPYPDETRYLRQVGERLAQLGFPLQPMIASFHVKCRELWSCLVAEAERLGPPAPLQLLSSGVTIWERLHAATTALADGYGEELSRQEVLKTRSVVHFIDALSRDTERDECRSLAGELGFRPDGCFRSVLLVGPVASVDTARLVVAACQRDGAVAVSAPRGRTAVLVCQGLDRPGLERCLAVVPAGTPVGVGLEGEGLDGARTSLQEAEQVLELAVLRRGACHFEDDWALASGLSQRPSLERILERGVALALARPHLAEAVEVFAASGYSLTRAAVRLHVSQSTVAYRLRRWSAQTGWDPWSPVGLVNALMALELARARR